MNHVERITKLLSDESPRTRVAAAVVLGALKVKEPPVIAGLMTMANDPLDQFAQPALVALGQLKSVKALPVFFAALGRAGEVADAAKVALGELGPAAVPAIKAQLERASPQVRAALSQVLPHVGGRASFELTLEGLRGQPWDAVNQVALSVRAEAKSMSEAERRVLKTQIEKFLAKKTTAADEHARRGAIKALGFLGLPETTDLLLRHLANQHPSAVRLEATTALRFVMARAPSKKAVRALMALLVDGDALVVRAARDSLTVLDIGTEFADELADLCQADDGEVARWAIERLGALAAAGAGASAKLAAKTLEPVARGTDRARAEAAAKALVGLPHGQASLVNALAEATDETGAQVLAEALAPRANALTKKELATLLAAGEKKLTTALAIARRQLEPVRTAAPAQWAAVLRAKMKALQTKDAARADALGQLLAHSEVATPEDRYTIAVQQLTHHNLDPHPKARQRDTVLAELERLLHEGIKVGALMTKDQRVSDNARYYVGVHFAEKPQFELKNVGAEVLEGLARGRTKLAKAAKNKLALLELA